MRFRTRICDFDPTLDLGHSAIQPLCRTHNRGKKRFANYLAELELARVGHYPEKLFALELSLLRTSIDLWLNDSIYHFVVMNGFSL